MSATNRGAVRHELDFYETPSWCTEALLFQLSGNWSKCVDLGCGTGSIGRQLVGLMDVVGYEIDPGRAAVARSHGLDVREIDLLTMTCGGQYKDQLVIMNPPYEHALAFVYIAQMLVQKGGTVCALLRLNWLASKTRAQFHKDHPSDVLVLPRRPSFTGDGKTDATDYAWFVWGPGRGGRWQIL